MWINDNKQHQRRNNVGIRRHDVQKDDNCKQSVAKFCREKLHIQGIDCADIDVAHLVLHNNIVLLKPVHKRTNRTSPLLSQTTSRPRHSSATTAEMNRSDCD